MNNFERAKFVASRALAQVDDFDVDDLFAADRLGPSNIDQVVRYIRNFERVIRDSERAA